MSNSHTMYARLCAIFFVLLFSSVAFGGATKVDVCHIPPDDPDNFHTIRISEKALPSHLKHGDLEGACEVDPEVECPCFSQADLETHPSKLRVPTNERHPLAPHPTPHQHTHRS